ncbi:MAG: hypothetical protein EGR23_03760 [Holdemanella biformis]|nr:hypothetical protein [Holdemanella biformis]
MNIIRVLKKSIREYKRDSILTPILVAFEALVECIIPLMVANLVNNLRCQKHLLATKCRITIFLNMF